MQIETRSVNFKKLFSVKGEQFVIPPYQRPYSWGPEQIDELWEDIIDTLGSDHFMGAMVFNTEVEDRPQVIDGQQRLVTLLLILALIRDAYHSRDYGKWDRPQDWMISDRYEEGDAQFKFRTGKANWTAFREFVLRTPTDPKRKQ